MLQSTVTLVSSAQMKAMKATPVEILAAPGAGKARLVILCVVEYLHITTGYVRPGGGDVELSFNSGAGNTRGCPGSAIESATTDFLGRAEFPIIENGSLGYNNQPYEIFNNGSAEWTTGDGTLRVTTYFVEQQVN